LFREGKEDVMKTKTETEEKEEIVCSFDRDSDQICLGSLRADCYFVVIHPERGEILCSDGYFSDLSGGICCFGGSQKDSVWNKCLFPHVPHINEDERIYHFYTFHKNNSEEIAKAYKLRVWFSSQEGYRMEISPNDDHDSMSSLCRLLVGRDRARATLEEEYGELVSKYDKISPLEKKYPKVVDMLILSVMLGFTFLVLYVLMSYKAIFNW
jgi:hypothetical protein